jgi:hypothetical protein
MLLPRHARPIILSVSGTSVTEWDHSWMKSGRWGKKFRMQSALMPGPAHHQSEVRTLSYVVNILLSK